MYGHILHIPGLTSICVSQSYCSQHCQIAHLLLNYHNCDSAFTCTMLSSDTDLDWYYKHFYFLSEYAFDIRDYLFEQFVKNPSELIAFREDLQKDEPPTLASQQVRPEKSEAIANFKSRYSKNTLQY